MIGLACAAAAGPAVAGTIYRCETGDGVTSYVSRRISGATCAVATTYRSSRPSRPSQPSTTPGAVGGATASTAVAGSPASINTNAPATFMGAGGATPAASTGGVSTTQVPSAPSSTAGSRRLVQGQVYSYVKDGVRHYTSRKPAGGGGADAVRTIRYSFFETCYACGSPGLNFSNVRLNTAAYDAEVKAASQEFGVEEAIIRAIMHAESAFNPNALSRVGAQGLMQLMPATADRFGVVNAFDPAQNIRGGVRYLAWLLKRFNGDLTLAAAGYNAGEGAVDRHKGVPPYNETRRYVERVGVLADRYRANLAAN
ncbi:lytic transglycosylase domain-containing protein [Luteimonas sp. MC1895]|uniref:lytic transglycosylase domain-containing protein n=1 Tax=Luteimonas sp. MC1895 TaxID=2819513 RepID=UPI0018F06C52|nr:lytic transglycosylase domain-containing protein [Luteimonas sp. MC1895]MBJ6978765.1 transglycosylase SLT domain-containing protein [Luteimonas sp. MC1895]